MLMHSQTLRVVFILHGDVYRVEVIEVERFRTSFFGVLECSLSVLTVAVMHGVAAVARFSEEVLFVPRVVTAVRE